MKWYDFGFCKHRKVALKNGTWTEGICYECRQPVERINKYDKWTIPG